MNTQKPKSQGRSGIIIGEWKLGDRKCRFQAGTLHPGAVGRFKFISPNVELSYINFTFEVTHHEAKKMLQLLNR